MIQVKHFTPMRCKRLQRRGLVSMSILLSKCRIGVEPYKRCKRCVNKVKAINIEEYRVYVPKEGDIVIWDSYTEEGGAE